MTDKMTPAEALSVLDKALDDLLASDGEYNFHTASRERLHQARAALESVLPDEQLSDSLYAQAMRNLGWSLLDFSKVDREARRIAADRRASAKGDDK
jgi:hypothetical protein